MKLLVSILSRSCLPSSLFPVVYFSSRIPETASAKTFGDRKRCNDLSSLQDEYFVLSQIDVLLAQNKVQHAEPLFNRYRREGHQFKAAVYNQIIEGWLNQENELKASILYQSMTIDDVSPNHTTYAILLSHYANSGNMSEIDCLINEMKEQGYSPSRLPYQAHISKERMTALIKLLGELGLIIEKPPAVEKNFPPLVKSFYNNNNSVTNFEQTDTSIPKLFEPETLWNQIQSQLKMEERCYEKITSIARAAGKNDFASSRLGSLYHLWEKQLVDAIRKEIKYYEECLLDVEEESIHFHQVPKHLPFLAALTPEQWARLAMENIVKNVITQPNGLALYYLCTMLTMSAWRHYVIHEKQKRGITEKMLCIYKDYFEHVQGLYVDSKKLDKSPREIWQEIKENHYASGTLDPHILPWPRKVGFLVGSCLIDIILSTLKLPEDAAAYKTDSESDGEYAFKHMFVQVKEKKHGHIAVQYSLYRMFTRLRNKAGAMSFNMDSSEIPMKVPPQPWTEATNGAFLLTPSSVVRTHYDSFHHQLLLKAADSLSPVLDSLNYLSLYPWRVNKRILDMAIDIFNKGGDKSLDIPTDEQFDKPLPEYIKDCDEETRKRIYKERFAIKKENAENFSLKMTLLYNLSMCNHFRDCLFWLPHNMDFRGRVYPIPPHLNHMSNDLSRSLLQFGVGCPLGRRGLEWLKIHIATLHGAKSKSSLNERLEYTDSIIDDIADSADRPLEGNGWWRTSDVPWQTLAACIELMDALRSGDPENFISHVTVHQDGSCNGLQHYAAMGRDVYGAKQVNLVPSERPANLYAEVAKLVDEKRKADAMSDQNVEIAQILEGKVHRKVVKQTVMTVVYGVTFVGGRLQIEKQLKGTIPDEHLFKASSYLCRLVFESLSEMFERSRKIQDWLASSARKIALAGHPTQWVTPIGLPVVQPYHRKVIKTINSKTQHLQLLNDADITRPPNPVKQRSAMPPNFVHSLDSTHMMLTALHCQKSGIPFVAVHDSYWAHGHNIDEMNKICREQFVALHSQPILKDLANFFEDHFGGLSYKTAKEGKMVTSFLEELPSQGELDLDCIKDSTYFFS